MARQVQNPFVGRSILSQELHGLMEQIERNQTIKARREQEDNRHEEKILSEGNRHIENMGQLDLDNIKNFEDGHYDNVFKAVASGNIKEINDIQGYFLRDEDGQMKIDKLKERYVPEESRDLYLSGEKLQSTGQHRIEFHKTNQEGKRKFSNTLIPEEDRLAEFDRVYKLVEQGLLSQSYLDDYYRIAKANKMASLGYADKQKVEKPKDYTTEFSRIGTITQNWKSDWSGTEKAVVDWTDLMGGPGAFDVPFGVGYYKDPKIAGAYKTEAKKKASEAFSSAIISGKTREMFQPISEGGWANEYGKQKTFAKVAGLAVESIPELADLTSYKAIKARIEVDAIKEKLVAKLVEAFGPEENWIQYLKNENGMSTIDIIR